MPQGLTLTLGGAPDTWHSVTGLPGWFHPSIPVPVGDDGQIPLDIAKKASKDPGCPVKLGEHSVKALDAGARGSGEQRAQTLRAVRIDRQVIPPDQLTAAVDAVKEK